MRRHPFKKDPRKELNLENYPDVNRVGPAGLSAASAWGFKAAEGLDALIQGAPSRSSRTPKVSQGKPWQAGRRSWSRNKEHRARKYQKLKKLEGTPIRFRKRSCLSWVSGWLETSGFLGVKTDVRFL